MSWDVLRCACVSRVITLIGLYVASQLPAFDDSASALLGPGSRLVGFVRWDTLYFLRIALNGYTREQEHAFQPGLPTLMRWIGRGVQAIRSGDELETSDVVIAGIIAANLAAISATLTLYRCVTSEPPSNALSLTLAVTKDVKLSKLTALLYCIPPSPPTLSVPYTEPFFALFVFAGMLMVERRRLMLGATSFALATSFRATGIFNVGFIVWHTVIASRLQSLLAAVVLSLFVVGPFAWSQWVGYSDFCLVDSLRPWCSNRLPLIYSFVQDHYWENGFLRYWTLQQSPLFVLSAPVLALSIYASYRYYRTHDLAALHASIPFIARPLPVASGHAVDSPTLLPHIHLHTLLTILLLFFGHVQICLRQAATNPVIFWFAADLLQQDWRADEADKKRSLWGKFWVRYCVIWGSIATVLWAVFLPPA